MKTKPSLVGLPGLPDGSEGPSPCEGPLWTCVVRDLMGSSAHGQAGKGSVGCLLVENQTIQTWLWWRV